MEFLADIFTGIANILFAAFEGKEATIFAFIADYIRKLASLK